MFFALFCKNFPEISDQNLNTEFFRLIDTSDLVETADLGLVSDMTGLVELGIFFLSLKDGSILTLEAREEDPSRDSLLTELGLVCVAMESSDFPKI